MLRLTSLRTTVALLPLLCNTRIGISRALSVSMAPTSSLAKRVTMESFQNDENKSRCPITLFVYATMNGYKGPVCAEELGIDYNYVMVDFEKGEQKSPEYLKINPKGQIPALYDADNGVFLAESAAILEYLAGKYHHKQPTMFPTAESDAKLHWAIRQWMLFSATGLAPAMGNAMFFNRIAKTKGENNEFAIQRYTNQSRGLLKVLDQQLQSSGGPFLLGKHLTIADVNAFTYASTHFWAMVDVTGLDALNAWIDMMMKREAVQKGLNIPFARPGFFGPPYATEEEIEGEIQRNAGMFTKGGGSSKEEEAKK
ncbi:S-transferase domain-containing protein DDB [Seminavis robusta]|uniref:S-transferase domain-containing protein DDB n=1 Tax=Seminavis robusta TaxID=568900 RepID=A0A9N8HLU7_9STRA|nr:S-transferase domain-containing protein DDB [Seminavis robusta]|eukprot:Sro945_g223090.1 S-transferase domain-containing protein DDB (312) ;mRNA; f:8587-9800